METTIDFNIEESLSKYHDKQMILKDLIFQLEKDTGLDYTETLIDINNPDFTDNLKNDLVFHLKKVASQNHSRFMFIINRVDIPQAKFKKLEMDENYFSNLSDMILNRMFQKTITKRFIK